MKQVLIIDDDEKIREVLQQLLERKGYDVLVAPEGKSGMMYCRDASPNLVITDIVMPEMEGIEVIIELRKSFPDAKVIAISGGGQIEPKGYLKTAKLLGANCTFTKPLIIREILEAVDDLMGD